MTSQQPYTFDDNGRMKYHSDVHTNQGKPWTTLDQQYLIQHYEAIGPDQMSIELGRTIATVQHKVYMLRKNGVMPKRKTVKRFPRNVGFKP